MLRLPRWRVVLVILVTVFGLLFAAPNLIPKNIRDQMPAWIPHRTLNLGLDLQGGSYLLLEVDTATLRRAQLDNIADNMATALRNATPAIQYTGRGVIDNAARVRLVHPEDIDRAMTALRPLARSPEGRNDILTFAQGADGLIEARMTDAELRSLSRAAAQQSIEVIRRRVDPTGANEINPVRQGDDRIVVQAPGVSDPEQLKSRIGHTALMTFNLVATNASTADAAAGRIPPGFVVVQPYGTIGRQAEVVRRRPALTGEHLSDARPSVDQRTQEWVLSFKMDSEGTHIFCRITREHTGERFAILLDDQVLTAPTINEPICGGSGQITGSFTAESASELSLMLRSGALPAPLTVIEQRTVTAELGQDAVNAGSTATLVGAVAVVAFMVLAYGLFGALACLALFINIAQIIAVMSLSGATLSLPGIAGLILTMGMAVDANVLIYERMREEQANGRGPAIAIDAGFSRALVTIIDSHVTQIGVALILFWFGHGPVRGFAWTLSIGVVTSVITATLVTQLFIAIWFRIAKPKKLPI